MRIIISVRESGRRACSLQHVQAALDNISQVYFGPAAGIAWRVEDVHEQDGCWSAGSGGLTAEGEDLGTLEAVATGVCADRRKFTADLLDDLRHRTGGTKFWLTLDNLPPTSTTQHEARPVEIWLAEAQRLLTASAVALEARVQAAKGQQYYREQHLRLARQELCSADLNVRLALMDLDIAAREEAAVEGQDQAKVGDDLARAGIDLPTHCDRCGSRFVEGDELAEVAGEEDGDSNDVIHQSCMRPGEQVA